MAKRQRIARAVLAEEEEEEEQQQQEEEEEELVELHDPPCAKYEGGGTCVPCSSSKVKCNYAMPYMERAQKKKEIAKKKKEIEQAMLEATDADNEMTVAEGLSHRNVRSERTGKTKRPKGSTSKTVEPAPEDDEMEEDQLLGGPFPRPPAPAYATEVVVETLQANPEPAARAPVPPTDPPKRKSSTSGAHAPKQQGRAPEALKPAPKACTRRHA